MRELTRFVAVATVNGINYLLTWNCTHIANVVMRLRIEAVCRRHGIEPPYYYLNPIGIAGGLAAYGTIQSLMKLES
jgi:hypothetical protein